MKITNCRSSVAFFIYCGTAVLVIVNGRPTTDDDIDRDEIADLKDRISKLESLITAAGKKINTKQDASKLCELTSRLFLVCVTSCERNFVSFCVHYRGVTRNLFWEV